MKSFLFQINHAVTILSSPVYSSFDVIYLSYDRLNCAIHSSEFWQVFIVSCPIVSSLMFSTSSHWRTRMPISYFRYKKKLHTIKFSELERGLVKSCDGSLGQELLHIRIGNSIVIMEHIAFFWAHNFLI